MEILLVKKVLRWDHDEQALIDHVVDLVLPKWVAKAPKSNVWRNFSAVLRTRNMGTKTPSVSLVPDIFCSFNLSS